MSASTMADPIQVFVSYVAEDESSRGDLYDHLSTLVRGGLITLWSDRDVPPGANRAREVGQRLAAADLILLLVSPSYLASDECGDVEVDRALARHEAGQARVVPIILRPCDWKDERLGRLRPAPLDGEPVSRWTSPDEAWTDVARRLRGVVRELSAARGS